MLLRRIEHLEVEPVRIALSCFQQIDHVYSNGTKRVKIERSPAPDLALLNRVERRRDDAATSVSSAYLRRLPALH